MSLKSAVFEVDGMLFSGVMTGLVGIDLVLPFSLRKMCIVLFNCECVTVCLSLSLSLSLYLFLSLYIYIHTHTHTTHTHTYILYIFSVFKYFKIVFKMYWLHIFCYCLRADQNGEHQCGRHLWRQTLHCSRTYLDHHSVLPSELIDSNRTDYILLIYLIHSNIQHLKTMIKMDVYALTVFN